MDPKEKLPDKLQVVKDPKPDLNTDPRIAQPPPSTRATKLAIWAAVAVIAILGLYLAFPGTLDDASEITQTPAVVPLKQETPKGSNSSPSGDDTQAEPTEKSQ